MTKTKNIHDIQRGLKKYLAQPFYYGSVFILACVLVLMSVLYCPDYAFAQDDSWGEITEFAGLSIANNAAKAWNPDAELVAVFIWQTRVRESKTNNVTTSIKLLCTGWQYYYRAGDKFYQVKVNIEDYDNNTASVAGELSQSQVDYVGVESFKPLGDWEVNGPNAIKIAANSFQMSLLRGDVLTSLGMHKPDDKDDAPPIWYVSLSNGETGVTIKYQIDANTGEVLVPAPATSTPVTSAPATTEPLVTEPVTSAPVTTEPLVTEPAVTEPEAGLPLGVILGAVGGALVVLILGTLLTRRYLKNRRMAETKPEAITWPSAVEGSAADVFISHVEEDGMIASEIARGLNEKGYASWSYEVDSLPGPGYLDQVFKAIQQARAIVLIISPNSLGSEQVNKEIVLGHENSKPFIPVLSNITHNEFQKRRPSWRLALGDATSIQIPDDGATKIIPRLINGLRALDIHPRNQTD